MSFLGVISAFALSMFPIFEVRGAIPIAVAFGLNVWTAFIIALIANILLIPLVFLFLDNIHVYFMNISLYSNLFNRYLVRVRGKAESKIHGLWPYLALFGFVGLPLPGTCIWTGVLVSWFFKMDRKKSYLSLMLGSVCVSLIVLFITLGFIKIW